MVKPLHLIALVVSCAYLALCVLYLVDPGRGWLLYIWPPWCVSGLSGMPQGGLLYICPPPLYLSGINKYVSVDDDVWYEHMPVFCELLEY